MEKDLDRVRSFAVQTIGDRPLGIAIPQNRPPMADDARYAVEAGVRAFGQFAFGADVADHRPRLGGADAQAFARWNCACKRHRR